MKRLFVVIMMAYCMPGIVFGAENAEIQRARDIQNKHQDSVIWVSAVLKSQMTGMGVQFGHGSEQKVESLGTIIDPSGLTVCSLSMLDPMSMIMGMMSGMGGSDMKIDSMSQLSDVKMRLADGTEITAKLVLQDPDLDLVFVMPEKKKDEKLPEFKSISLGKTSKARILDKLVVLSRLGKSLARQPAIHVSRVSAIVKKPRTFYIGATIQSFGTPVFTLDDKILGITVMRKAPMTGGMGGMMAMAMGGGMSPVILPAKDVMEVAQQALVKNKEAKGRSSDLPGSTESKKNLAPR